MSFHSPIAWVARKSLLFLFIRPITLWWKQQPCWGLAQIIWLKSKQMKGLSYFWENDWLICWIKHKFSRAYGMNYVFTFKLRSFEWKIFIFSLLIVNEYVIFSPVNGKWVCFSQSYLVIVYLIILRYSTFTYSACTRMELAECNVILFTEFYVTEYSQSVTWWL